MPYQYFGKPTLYKGKPLFKILARLKDFGKGRIVYRTIEHYDHPGQISFYRILLAQPLMDKDTIHGRVVAEHVYCGLRHKEPAVLSAVAHKPDFRLVPKDEEKSFCQWDKIVDYDPTVHAPKKPKYFEMPPLLREVLARRGGIASAGEISSKESQERDYKLPAHKIYKGDVILTDEVQPHSLSQFLTEEFATHKDFSVEDIPESWATERYNLPVGRRKWEGFIEDSKRWLKQEEKQKEWDELLKLKRQKDLEANK